MIAFIMLINCYSFSAKASTLPASVAYKWSGKPLNAKDINPPSMSENGYSVFTYTSSTGTSANSYIVYDANGKVVYQNENDDSVGDNIKVSVINSTIMVVGSNMVKVMDFTGNLQWSQSLNSETKVFNTESDLFIYESQTNNISKINLNNGTVSWTYHVPAERTNVQISGYDPKLGNLLITSNSTSIYAIHNGELQWTVNAPDGSKFENLAVSKMGTIASSVITENTRVLNVYSNDGKLKWQHNLGTLRLDTVWFDEDDHVYYYDQQERQFKFFDGTGKISNTFTSVIHLSGDPIFIGSNLYFLCHSTDSNGNKLYYVRKVDRSGRTFGQTQFNSPTNIVQSGIFTMDDLNGTVVPKFYKFSPPTVMYQNPRGYFQVQYTQIQPTGKVGYNLSLGFEGVKTWVVMNKLGIIGTHGYAKYNYATKSAVSKFQKKNHLPVTGIVDVKTWKKLGFSESSWYSIDRYISPLKTHVYDGRQAHIEAMISEAYKYLNKPYIVGAASSSSYGVDCSGLVTQALYAAGISPLPVSSIQHAYPGNEYNSRKLWATPSLKNISYSKRQRGDLIFYYKPGTKIIIHVAIYLGNDKVIEAWPPRVMVQPIKNSHRSVIAGVKRPFQ
jgi:cell wall-associated NlpC family hydrolase